MFTIVKQCTYLFMCFNGFWSEDDPLMLKHVAAVNTADNVVVLTVL